MSAVVTQADRERAWPYRPSCYKDRSETKARWMDGTYDRAAPVIQAFAAHREAHTAGLDWQPIETAPKDGTRLLVGCTRYFLMGMTEATEPLHVAYWDSIDQRWNVEGWPRPALWQPTHWRPLPAPPATGAAK